MEDMERNLPRSTAPSASSRSSAPSMSSTDTGTRSASSALVIGPECCIQPRTSLRTAAGRTSRAPSDPTIAANVSARSVATQYVRPPTETSLARRSRTSSAKNCSYVGRLELWAGAGGVAAGQATSVSNASCSSSASRTSGHASWVTCAIAA
jgi:hypothetical protein